jgi:hypothetical protein
MVMSNPLALLLRLLIGIGFFNGIAAADGSRYRKPDIFSDFLSLSKSFFSRKNFSSQGFRDLALIGGGLYLLDEKIQDEVESHKIFSNETMGLGQRFGSKGRLIPAMGALYAAGYLTDNYKLKCMTLDGMEALAFSSGMTEIIKSVNRTLGLSSINRPKEGDKRGHLPWPSGHAAGAVSIATTFSHYYGHGRRRYLSWAAYGLALLTTYSRVDYGAHWASDAFFGAVIGYYTTKNLLKMHRPDGKRSDHGVFFDGEKLGYWTRF